MDRISEETKSTIIHLWNEDKSAGEIAALLQMTRNSVIGIVYRARKNFEKGNVRQERKKKEKPPKKVRANSKKIKIKPIVEVVDVPIIEITPKIDLVESCTLNELKYNSCRYIVCEGNYETTKYCGKQIDRESYCQHHYSICYYPSKRQAESLWK